MTRGETGREGDWSNLLDNQDNNMEYSFWKSLFKTVIRLALVGIPILITTLPPSWSAMTVGGVLMMAFDYVKAKYATL